MVRRNMAKVHARARRMHENRPQRSHARTRPGRAGSRFQPPVWHAPQFLSPPRNVALGLVMPSNSPGVNSLWLPAIPLKIPVILKPGREEPWTPFRIIQAFIAAGCPAGGLPVILSNRSRRRRRRSCARLRSRVPHLRRQKTPPRRIRHGNPAIQIHGPGYSKILIGDDEIERWPEFIDLIVSSHFRQTAGRSCINASAVVVPRHAAEIAAALAAKTRPCVSPPLFG